MQGFHEVEHKADIGLEIFGESYEQLFTQAIYGFYSILLPDIDLPIKKAKEKSKVHFLLKIKETSPENALVSLLNELNFLFTVKRIILLPVNSLEIYQNSKFEVQVQTGLIADIPDEWSDEITEIKAVTYHNLKIKKIRGVYRVQVIFDV